VWAADRQDPLFASQGRATLEHEETITAVPSSRCAAINQAWFNVRIGVASKRWRTVNRKDLQVGGRTRRTAGAGECGSRLPHGART
jgi:hypothetical protein